MWELNFTHQKVWNHFSSWCIIKTCTQYFRCEWRSLLSCSNTVWNSLLWMRSDWVRWSAFVHLFPCAEGRCFQDVQEQPDCCWILHIIPGHRSVGKQFQVFLACLCPLVCCVHLCSGSRPPCAEWQILVATRGFLVWVTEHMLLGGAFLPSSAHCGRIMNNTRFFCSSLYSVWSFLFLERWLTSTLKLTSHSL